MKHSELSKIAEEVSQLMQLDRSRHKIGTAKDFEAASLVPNYIASVFEEANQINATLSPNDVYHLLNKRMSQLQAQLYLIRLELENRDTRDPAAIYQDPLVIGAYGEEIKTSLSRERTYDFGTHLLAHGWYAVERDNGKSFRWMRPGGISVACVPHLGEVDQILEISGDMIHAEQMDTFSIRSGATEAVIEPQGQLPVHFKAVLGLKGEDLKGANYIPIEFHLADFRQPNDKDTRLLGAKIHQIDLKLPESPQNRWFGKPGR